MKLKLFALAMTLALPALLFGQRGGPGFGGRGFGGQQSVEEQINAAVQRLMSMDGNSDGVLTAAEIADPRLRSLMDQADTNNDDQVTKTELTEYFTAKAEQASTDGRGQGPMGMGGGPGMGPGGPGARSGTGARGAI